MDRTGTLRDVRARLGRATSAANSLSVTARQLPQWGAEAGAHGINTAMGTAFEGIRPRAPQLQLEMENGMENLGFLEDWLPAMPDSPPWSEPAWDMWWHEHCAALARYNEARINHMLLHALSFNGPIPAAVRNQITPLGPHLADMNTHITSLSPDLPGLASSFVESLDTCWPSAKSRLAAHAKRDAEVDSMRPFLSRVLSIDRSRTRIEASLATANEMNDHSEVDRCNREFREIDGQMAAAMRAIYQEFEGLTPGTSRVKEIRMDLRDAITTPIDPIKLINAIVKHVATYIGDYPTIAADIKLMWADFDPQSGLFWNSDIERIDVGANS